MVAILILFSLMAVILLFGIIGDKDAQNRKNFTYAFCSLIVAIAIVILKFM